jgi:hypothetical protein
MAHVFSIDIVPLRGIGKHAAYVGAVREPPLHVSPLLRGQRPAGFVVVGGSSAPRARSSRASVGMTGRGGCTIRRSPTPQVNDLRL